MFDLRKRRRKITKCKLCGKSKDLSRRGYCADCSKRKNQLAIAQMRAKEGKTYEKWRDNLIKAMEKL